MTEIKRSSGNLRSRSVGTNVRMGFASVAFLLLLSAGVSQYNARQLFENTTRLAKNHDIQYTLGDILSTMKDAETGQRGYVITGAKEFLAPFNTASDQVPLLLDRLSVLSTGRPEQHAPMASLQKKIEICLALSRQNIALRDQQGLQAALDFAANGQGKRAMDEIRGLVAEMMAAAHESQRKLDQECSRSYAIALIANLFVVLFGLALVAVAFEIVRREIAAHHVTMDALHEQQERLRVTLTSIGDGVIVTDSQGVVVFLNPVAGALTGWHQEAVGQPLADVFRIIAEATGQPCESPVAKVLREGTIVGLANHTLLIARDGKKIAIDDSGAPIRDERGQIDGVVLVFRDITGRKHTEDTLRQSEQELADFFENATVGLHWVGPDGIILRVNAAELELLGYTREEYVGQSIVDFHADAHAIADILARLKAGEVVDDYHARLRCKDGSIRHVLINSSAMWSDGKFIHTRCFTRDITERKRAEDALRTSELRYRRLFETSRNAMLILDAETGSIIDANPILTDLTGYGLAEVHGKQLWQVGIFENQESNESAMRRFREQGYIHYDQLSIGTKAGAQAEAECVAIAYEMDQKEFIQFSIHDITARVRAEEALRGVTDQLRERVEQLRDADRRKNEFLAMLAHELRNPLAPVQNAVHLLRKNCPTDPETQWAHDVIEHQVQHMTRMVDDLLDVSRITRGMINLQKKPIEIAAAVHRAVEMTQPLIDARQHRLTISLPADPVHLDADPPRLTQVLANLLNNAAKYTDEGGQIWLTVERQGTDVVVKVRDTGVGIPSEYLPHVFDLFSQKDGSLERTHGGLGIGLTLVRILVNMHGGAIQAFSAGSGQGSEFVLRLPALADIDAAQVANPTAEHPAADPTPRRILVVDDNVDGAKSLSMLLRHDGHEVLTAFDGPSALEIARTNPVDIVLLDIGMPHMSGLEVARRLRGEFGLTDALLIAMTGYGQDEDRQRSREAGFNAHMTKPIDVGELQAILARFHANSGATG